MYLKRFLRSLLIVRLLQACPSDEDPAALLKNAAREHLPADPFLQPESKDGIVPGALARPSIPEVIEEIKKQDWYRGQIAAEQSIEKKDPEYGA